jgi:hypothetical protein
MSAESYRDIVIDRPGFGHGNRMQFVRPRCQAQLVWRYDDLPGCPGSNVTGSLTSDPDSNLFGTLSLRRTKVTLIYRRTVNLSALQRLLGHTKIECTVHYLSIEVDDALAGSRTGRRPTER